MIYCLNPECTHPENQDRMQFCITCGTSLVSLLRGRYRVITLLGGGGFGRTYLAEDIDKLNEVCVVKQLVPKVSGSWAIKKATELFEQEAKRLQELGKHNQIPSLYAYFKENNYLYLVQEYIQGPNLLQELEKQGVYDELKARELLANLLPVLDILHNHQVVHRDIKLENIIRRESDGKPVLIDFGVSKQKTVVSDPSNPTTSTKLGSFGYAPFEQLHDGQAYPASDLYSMAVSCFYLLTNVSPHHLFIQHGYNWVKNWRQYLKQAISPELAEIFDKLLQQDYKQRYQSAQTVLQDVLNLKNSHTQFSTQKLLPWTVITAATNSFIIIALLSFISSIWMSFCISFLILLGLIVMQKHSILEKSYLYAIAAITTIVVAYISHSILQNHNIFQAGLPGVIMMLLLVTLAGVIAFVIIILSQLINKLISEYL